MPLWAVWSCCTLGKCGKSGLNFHFRPYYFAPQERTELALTWFVVKKRNAMSLACRCFMLNREKGVFFMDSSEVKGLDLSTNTSTGVL